MINQNDQQAIESNKIMKCIDRASLLRGYSFTEQEAYNARDRGGLLCLRLDTNYTCNLNCRYCYAGNKLVDNKSVLPLVKAKNIIEQARELGAQSVVFLGGGEPLLYSDYWDLLKFITSLDMIPVVFTNGTLLTKENVARMYDIGISILIKFDGFEQIQDHLSGEGSAIAMRRGLDLLLAAGFADNIDGYTRLGASICVCNENHIQVPEIWRYLRKRNIFPDIERVTIVGNATSEMDVAPSKIQAMFNAIKNIDKNEFGIEWESPFSSIPGHSCFICIAGCHVTADFKLSICPEMPAALDLTNITLADALGKSPFSEMRDIEHCILMPCKSCSFLHYCLGGCRSKALCRFGSILAPDPYCQFVCTPDNNE